MTEMGKAMMGTGEAAGERRAIDAAEAAISNPLLDDVSMKGARGVLINITGGTRHDPVRGRRGGQPHPRRGRPRRQHHLRLDLRPGPGRPHARLGGRHRHRSREDRPAASGHRDRSPERGRRRRKAMSPAPAPAGLSAQARQPTDYHHTLVASPPHPGAAQGHAPSAYTTHGHIPQSQRPDIRSRATTVIRRDTPRSATRCGPSSNSRSTMSSRLRSTYAPPQPEQVAPPAPVVEPQPMQHPDRVRAAPPACP